MLILQPSYICHIKRSIDESVWKWDIIPEEIESGKYVVDLDYYRENQLIPPLKRIVEKICNDPRSLFMFHRVCKPKVTGVFASWVKKEEDEPSYEAQKQRVTKKTKKKLLMDFF